MTRSRKPTNSRRRGRLWLRRGHRWVGVSAVVFVLFLAISGITLNHAADLGLDRRYISWSWLLDAYGMQAPPATASYADGGNRVTLMGDRLFLNGRDTDQRLARLAGLVVMDPLMVAAGQQTVQVFTVSGDAVVAIELSALLPGPIERVGRSGRRAVLQSNNMLFRSDSEIAVFEPWTADPSEAIQWSAATLPDTEELAELDAAWRGRGVTIERVLLDLHSGRLFSMPGALFMDLVALCMIVLGISGLVLSNARYRRENGSKGG